MVEVLVCLAEHAGGTVSKDELHQRVWGDTFVTDDVLTRCISELRRALEDDPKEPHVIQTIARKGYRLVPQVSPVKKKTSRRYLIAPVVLLATLVAGLAYIRLRHPPAAIHSLAVLPLKNLSGDPEQEYFADGLTDELTAALAKLGTLRVISRSSAALYRDTPKPLPQVATELNVEAVVTGSVERSGNRVRVRTKLVLAGTDEVLWAESYDRNLDDALGLEGEVSQAIAREVGIKLTPPSAATAGTQTDNLIPRPVTPICGRVTSSTEMTRKARPSACNISRKRCEGPKLRGGVCRAFPLL